MKQMEVNKKVLTKKKYEFYFVSFIICVNGGFSDSLSLGTIEEVKRCGLVMAGIIKTACGLWSLELSDVYFAMLFFKYKNTMYH